MSSEQVVDNTRTGKPTTHTRLFPVGNFAIEAPLQHRNVVRVTELGEEEVVYLQFKQ